MARGCRLYWMLLLLGEIAVTGCRDPNPAFIIRSSQFDARPTPDGDDVGSTTDVIPIDTHPMDVPLVVFDAISPSEVGPSDAAMDVQRFDTGFPDKPIFSFDTNLLLPDGSRKDVIAPPPSDTRSVDVSSPDSLKPPSPDANPISADTNPIPKDTSPDSRVPDVSLDSAPTLANGVACTLSSECKSGACTDGVCCASQLCGACEFCNLPNTAGICASTCASGQTCQTGVCKPSRNYQRVSGGGNHSCLINLDESISCWGWDFENEISDIPAGRFSEIASGYRHNCALRVDGSVVCWAGSLAYRNSIKLPSNSSSYSQVSSGGDHSCALRVDGSVVCWGANDWDQSLPVPTGSFIQVSAGGEHSCALRANGSVVCWGKDESVQASFSQISAGDFYTCGIKIDGSISCWGAPSGALYAPATIPGSFSQVSCGSEHTCALSTNGNVSCWGNDAHGKVSNTPKYQQFIQIEAGFDHTCALKADNSVICWGSDEYKQLSR